MKNLLVISAVSSPYRGFLVACNPLKYLSFCGNFISPCIYVHIYVGMHRNHSAWSILVSRPNPRFIFRRMAHFLRYACLVTQMQFSLTVMNLLSPSLEDNFDLCGYSMDNFDLCGVKDLFLHSEDGGMTKLSQMIESHFPCPECQINWWAPVAQGLFSLYTLSCYVAQERMIKPVLPKLLLSLSKTKM